MMTRTRSTAVKALGPRTIGGYGAVFGSPDERDLYGDYFSAKTDFMLDLYPSRPVFYDHTLGILPAEMDLAIPRNFLLGRDTKAVVDTVGLWIEAVLLDHEEWAKMVQEMGIDIALTEPQDYKAWVNGVMQLIDQNKMHWSSGSAGHLVTYGPDQEILSWPVVEMSVTPTPAEPRQTDIVRLKHFVNKQDAPEATADKAARHITPEIVRPIQNTNQKSKEQNTMTLKLTEKTVKRIVWDIADANQGQLKAAIVAYKQELVEAEGDPVEPSNAVAELVRPMAEELATIAGTDVEAAQQYLIEYVAAHAASEEPSPEEPVEMPIEGPMMSTAAAQKMADSAAQKAVQSLIQSSPDGAFVTKARTIKLQKPKPVEFSFVRGIRSMINHDHAAMKAMGLNPDTAGGLLVPSEQSNQVIELLRSGAPVLGLCRVFPMNRDTLEIPSLTSGSTAYWTPEHGTITASTPAPGQITLVAKKLTAMVQISNEWLEDSDPEMEAMIREDIAQTLAEAVDNAILEGSGVASEPRGLANIANVTKTALNAAPTIANLTGAISRVEIANAKAEPPWQWVFHPREKNTLANVADTTSGDYLWTEMGLPGHTMVGGYPATLRGYPFKTTTQISIDTDNNDETKIYFGQWNDVVVGMRKTLELRASSEAGTSFQADQTWIRAIMRLDVNIRHPESIEILTDVRTS